MDKLEVEEHKKNKGTLISQGAEAVNNLITIRGYTLQII